MAQINPLVIQAKKEDKVQKRSEFGLGLRAKLVAWVSLALFVTLGLSTFFNASSYYRQIEAGLDDKAKALGQFFALISPQSIYGFDFLSLDRFVVQISSDKDVLFAAVVDQNHQMLTTALPDYAGISSALPIEVRLEQLQKVPGVVVYRFPIKGEQSLLGNLIIGMDTRPNLAMARKMVVLQVFGDLVIVLLLAILIYAIFNRHVLRPIGILMQGAQRISRGDFSTQADISSLDELGRLSDVFNRMMQEIKQDRFELLGANRRLEREIKQHGHTIDELQKLTVAVEQSPAAVVITDTEGHIEYVNRRFCELTRYSSQEVLGKNPRVLKSGHHPPAFYQGLWQALKAGTSWRGEFCNRRKDGGIYWEQAIISLVKDAQGKATHYIAIKEDITERRAIEEKLLQQATHDALTGLPNRFLALDRLQQLVERSRRHPEQQMVVVFIDLDNFKYINDTLGHPAGDQLLQEVSCRFLKQLRASDTLARLGGDEFLIILDINAQWMSSPNSIIDKLLSCLESPVEMDGQALVVGASFGVACFPKDGESADALLKNADAAMYEAKRSGKNRACYFTEVLNTQVSERLVVERELRKALDRQEFYLVYQPVIDQQSRDMMGVEMLLRWQNPTLGAVPPTLFIPLAEEIGIVESIEAWAMEKTFDELAELDGIKQKSLSVALNVSPRHFVRDDFLPRIQEIKTLSDKQGLKLVLEITEGLLLKDSLQVQRHFSALKEMGVEVSLDDFGTGYSSMAYLKRFDFSHIKIDRDFVRTLPLDTDASSLCESILFLANKLGLEVIAEGVEQDDQLSYLDALGVQYYQGFLFGKPMPIAKLKAWVEENRPNSLDHKPG